MRKKAKAYVLDTSALFAYIEDEEGAEIVEQLALLQPPFTNQKRLTCLQEDEYVRVQHCDTTFIIAVIRPDLR